MARKYMGLKKLKYPTKMVRYKFKKVNRIYNQISKFLESDYEFVPLKKSENKKSRRIILKIFPQKSIPRVSGVWIPRRVAGPNPKIKMDFENGSFSVGARGIAPTDFSPIEHMELGVPEEDLDAKLDIMLSRYPEDAIIKPVSINGADLSQFGRSGNPAQVKKVIQGWIAAYGWHSDPDKRGKNDLGFWFKGFHVLKNKKVKK